MTLRSAMDASASASLLLAILLLCCAHVFGQDNIACARSMDNFTTLPVTGQPWKIGNGPWNTFLAEYTDRYSTTRNKKFLKLKFAKKDVSLESGSRFVASPEGVLPSEELTFQYKVYFKKGFNFVISGKLPGIYLGTFQEGYSTGKEYNDGQGSFRPTWQARGRKRAIVSPYLYGAHGDYDSALRAQGPKTSALLEGTGRAGVHFWMKGNSTLPLKSGWNRIELAIKLNTPGKADGKARVRINDRTNTLDDVSFRDRSDTKIQSIAMECFFGGSSKYHMTPGYQQTAKFKNIRVRPRY